MTLASLILFDFDDTLADTERHFAAAFFPRLQELLAPYRPLGDFQELVAKNGELYRLHGSSMHGWMHELGLEMDFTLQMFKDMAPTIREAVVPFMVPDSELHKRLAALEAKGHVLAILTHGHRDYCLPLLKLLGLDGFFPPERVFDISVLEGQLKRDEKTFRHVLDFHLRQTFDKMVMFEDSMTNLMAAKKAGFATVLVGSKHPPHDLDASIDFHTATLVEGIDRAVLELNL